MSDALLMNVAETTALGTAPAWNASTFTAVVLVTTKGAAYKVELVDGVELSSV